MRKLITDRMTGSVDGPPPALPDVYTELRRLAHRYLARERAGHTLPPTALVHEAYLRLERAGGAVAADRGTLVARAARAMRLALVDHARRRRACREPRR